MATIDFEKIKVNNAIIVFFLVVVCLCCPITILVLTNFKIIFDKDVLNIAIAAICIGCVQFTFTYFCNAIIVTPHIKIKEKEFNNYVFQTLLVEAVFFQIAEYILISISIIFFNDNIKAIGKEFAILDGVILIIALIYFIFSRVKKAFF